MDKSGGDVAKRGRGRPKKRQSTAKSAKQSSSAKSKKVDFTSSTKKMSGDMKLAQMAKKVADSMAKSQAAKGNSDSHDDNSNVVQKRGRGRPRKDASLIVAFDAKLPAKRSAASSGGIKRKLGVKVTKPEQKQTKKQDAGTGKLFNPNKLLYKK